MAVLSCNLDQCGKLKVDPHRICWIECIQSALFASWQEILTNFCINQICSFLQAHLGTKQKYFLNFLFPFFGIFLYCYKKTISNNFCQGLWILKRFLWIKKFLKNILYLTSQWLNLVIVFTWLILRVKKNTATFCKFLKFIISNWFKAMSFLLPGTSVLK